VVVALFAALIVPWFVNWNDYRFAFETEAEKVLGQPVKVNGTATATILPSPSLTFTDVEVGDPDGVRLMTVKRFTATIELMPLLQGEIRVVDMRLDQPDVRLAFDANGNAEWLMRSEASRALNPEKVVLEAVEIAGGRLTYSDARTGIVRTVEGIQAAVDARSLLGPWHVEGSYLEQGVRVPFRVATGLRQGDGSFRVKVDFTLPGLPISVASDGLASADAAGPVYRGTYSVSEVAVSERDGGSPGGWRSDGAFTLTPTGLTIDAGTLSVGPPERPTTVAGSLILPFGSGAKFTANVQARQLDVDRALGGGPNEPVDVARAQGQLADAIRRLPAPPLPGSLAFSVPAIVIGGALIQDVSLNASAGPEGWSIESFTARLPGQATLTASGRIASGAFSFRGNARLAVAQPATFATWLRGRSQDAGRLLPAFDLSGDVDIGEMRVAVDKATARIGPATVSGSFWWGRTDRDARRTLNTDLKADRIDFDALKSLADLLLGGNWTDTTRLADSFEVRLTAGALAYQDFAFRDVAVDARYADDILTVVRVAAAFDGGAVTVTGGRLENLRSAPRGRIDGRLEAASLEVPTRFVQRMLPNSSFGSWLQVAGPALGPANLMATLTAPADTGGEGLQAKLKGTAGGTTVDLTAVSRRPGEWREAPFEVAGTLSAQASAGLVRQAGFAIAAVPRDLPAQVDVRAAGTPANGLDATVSLNIAGIAAKTSGLLRIADDFALAFTGTIDAASDNLDRAVALAGLAIPGAATGTSVRLIGDLALGPSGASLKWSNATIAGQPLSGALAVVPSAERSWRIDGNMALEDVDLGWLMSLGLGFAPVPTSDPNARWSKTPFSSAAYGALTGRVAVTAARLALADRLDVNNARFDLTLAPQRLEVDLTAGEVAGGSVTGGFSIHNVAGNANLAGRFNLTRAALEPLVWRVDGRPVATGILDLAANFEGTGRTPAGLVATATGGGTLTITGGEARYLHGAAVRPLIRASDLGQQYTEDALRQAVGQVIGADSLRFDRADAGFLIVGGAARLRGLTLRATGLEAIADGVVDLNTLSLESDWTVTFDPGDSKVQSVAPKVGLLFRGALDAPRRTIDVLPLSAYLNARQQARMLDIIALEEASRLERDRLTRLTRRLAEEDARRAAEARAAAAAEAQRKASAMAALSAIVRLHDSRDTTADRLWVAGLRAIADRANADAASAQRTAEAARRAADAYRMTVESAQALVTRSTADEARAAAQADAAGIAVAAAQAAADAATRDVESAHATATASALLAAPVATGVSSVAAALAALETATKTHAERVTANASAQVALQNARTARATAQASLDAANAEAARLNEVARRASLDAAARTQAAADAQRAAERAASAGRFYIGHLAAPPSLQRTA
jgi:uncharacterized protein involved in outer membrane biogenesis